MLHLEAPRNLLQITNGTVPPVQALQLDNHVVWVQTMARQQNQPEKNLRQLTELCGNTIDRTNQRMIRIEEAYKTLADGTRNIYHWVHANDEIAEAWVRTELANAANAYQMLAQNIWQAIRVRTNEDSQREICQATQLTHVNDVLAFLVEANVAQSQHLTTFQGNVELWSADHQRKMTQVEEELQQARDEIQRIATRIPISSSPKIRRPSLQPLQLWRSPDRPPSTRAATAPAAPPPLSGGPTLQSPIRLAPVSPEQMQRRPVLPPSSPLETPLPPWPAARGRGGRGGGRPPRPGRPSRSPSPSSLTSGDDDDLYVQNLPMGRPPLGAGEPTRTQLATMLTLEEIARLVGAGIAVAQAPERPAEEAWINASRLKMENPEKFDGKSSSTFNQWWESVTMYLGFYLKMVDCLKITWVGTLLTDTALDGTSTDTTSYGITTHGPTTQTPFGRNTGMSTRQRTPNSS